MSAMLKDMEPQNIVGLLDLIQSVESKEHFQKVCSCCLFEVVLVYAGNCGDWSVEKSVFPVT